MQMMTRWRFPQWNVTVRVITVTVMNTVRRNVLYAARMSWNTITSTKMRNVSAVASAYIVQNAYFRQSTNKNTKEKFKGEI